MLFTDTEYCTAHYYLDDSGQELSRAAFINTYYNEHHAYGVNGYMFYVGPGFVKLTFAVLAYHENEAASIMEQWCLDNDRADEVNMDASVEDDDFGEYECITQIIPVPVTITPIELQVLLEGMKEIQQRSEGIGHIHAIARQALEIIGDR